VAGVHAPRVSREVQRRGGDLGLPLPRLAFRRRRARAGWPRHPQPAAARARRIAADVDQRRAARGGAGHSVIRYGTIMRTLSTLIFAGLCALGLAHCSKKEQLMNISPPLPPAEEPRDDVKGAYAGDAGAAPN